MQVKVENLEGLEREIFVQLPWQDFEEKSLTKLKELTKSVKIDGFRPGKAPAKLIKQRFGDSIEQDVLYEMIRQTLPEALEQESLNPASAPKLEPKPIEKGKPVEYTASFEIIPTITLKDLTDVKITKQRVLVADKDVDEALTALQEKQTKWEAVERAAEAGDQVLIDFEGTIDGEAFEHNKAQDYAVVIGEGQMIPGFEDGLKKLKTGDEHDLKVTFPDEYHAKDLAGKPAVFKVVVKAVSKPILPEIDAEFAKEWGIEDGNLDKLREEVKSGLEREAEQALKMKLHQQVMDKLLELNEFEIPHSMIDEEIDRKQKEMLHQMEHRYGLQHPTLPARETFLEKAKKDVALGLLMSQIIKDYEMKADPERVSDIIHRQATAYENVEQMVNFYYQNERLLRTIEAQALEEQLVEKMLEKAIVEEQETGYAEFVKEAKQKKDDDDE